MDILFIGGNGQISFDCVHEAARRGYDVTVFNRGMHNHGLPEDIRHIIGDFNDDDAYRGLGELRFDTICQFRVFTPRQMLRDIETFRGKTGQYVFISSASAYIKPPVQMLITEDVPLHNPFSEYSQDKADCEKILQSQDDLPYTIVRPSHTLRSSLPTALGEKEVAAWRIANDLPVIVPGDGTSLWTITLASDFARPFVSLFGLDKALSDKFHITSPCAYRWDQIYLSIARSLGKVNIDIVHVPTETLIRYNPEWRSGLLGDKAWTTIFDNSKISSTAGVFPFEQDLDKIIHDVVTNWQKESSPADGNSPEINRMMDSIANDQNSLPHA
ncbi:MAG: NAD-dependent epimerase/dehydratase family protein [Victivallales bacterium]|nr:NAD-dependent epimerase/dehydratase family protein [Victivallales bacterium]